MDIQGKRDAFYPGYVLPDADAIFKALHAEAYMQTTPENVEDVMDAVRRIAEAAVSDAQSATERRRDLANAKLPLDVECALEHVAIVMNQAHQQLTDVLRRHLPGGSDAA